MHRSFLFTVIALILVVSTADAVAGPAGAGPAGAAERSDAEGGYARYGLLGDGSGERPAGLLGASFLDRSRFSFSHSLSYGYSSGAGGSSAGLWVSRLGYRLADPLRLSLAVGAAITPGGETLLDGRNVFLHGLDLDYRPGRNFQMSISYRNVPGAAAPAYWMNRGGYGMHGEWWGGDTFAPRSDAERPARP